MLVIVCVAINKLGPWIRASAQLHAHSVPRMERLDVVVMKCLVRERNQITKAIELNTIIVVRTGA
jgi:hypothetical protein